MCIRDRVKGLGLIEKPQRQRDEDIEERGAKDSLFGGDVEERPLAGRQIGQAILGRQAAQPGEEVGCQVLVGGQQFELIEQHDDARALLIDLRQGAVEGAVGSRLGGRVQVQPGLRSRVEQPGIQQFINFFGRRAGQLLAIEQDEEGLGRIQAKRFAHRGVAQMQQERTLADAPRPDERYALAVAQQAQHLAQFGRAADEILDTPDGPTMKERIIYTHIPLL